MNPRHVMQELRELGTRGTLFRIGWELQMRTGLRRAMERSLPPRPSSYEHAWVAQLPFARATEVAHVIRERVHAQARETLIATAHEDLAGRVYAFGHTTYDYGDPVDWYLHPTSARRWNPSLHWTEALSETAKVGDPKLTWEPARFPHAYRVARAAALVPEQAQHLANRLTQQVEGFLAACRHPRGIHWASSQELELRLVAWSFAAQTFVDLGCDVRALLDAIVRHAWEVGHHTEREIAYAREAVYNNHLIAEALGLVVASTIAPQGNDTQRWRALGLSLLDAQAERQFYRDGAYLNLAHNYHRTVLHDYLLASRIVGEIPATWRIAMERSLDFLVAQQEPSSGALPNYGSNDGSMPRVLSTCAFHDFRPTLQALSVLTRGERLYPAGPWDEESAWLLGARALDVPLRPPSRRSVAFTHTGFYVLRGRDVRSFSVLRCGTVRDRFGQIDMLHLDVWWRGVNVLLDGGTYLYGGERRWLDHFLRTASHNTVTVDGHDQMLHWRQFKFLYWTQARATSFVDRGAWAMTSGSHSGYARHPGACVHHRAVLFVKDDLWVVFDRVTGTGHHHARLHWLACDAPHAYTPNDGTLTVFTSAGRFEVHVLDPLAKALPGDVARAVDEDPPRGWHARSYARKEPALSLAVVRKGEVPLEFVTVMGEGPIDVRCEAGVWRVTGPRSTVTFKLEGNIFCDVRTTEDAS